MTPSPAGSCPELIAYPNSRSGLYWEFTQDEDSSVAASIEMHEVLYAKPIKVCALGNEEGEEAAGRGRRRGRPRSVLPPLPAFSGDARRGEAEGGPRAAPGG